jgi:hypothetical protein
MGILKYFLGTFAIVSFIATVIGLLHQFRYIIFPLHILSTILLLSLVLATIFMILLYLIETNDVIKTIITDHVNNLGTNIKSHEENCQDNVIKLTEHISELSTNIQMQKKDITKQEEDTRWLSRKWDVIESLALEDFFKDSLDATQKANPRLVKKGSYILTDEGEEALPNDLKERIMDAVHGVKIESPEDTLDLLAKIGRDELKEFAKKSNLQFKEIVALSILYAIKMSEGCK